MVNMIIWKDSEFKGGYLSTNSSIVTLIRKHLHVVYKTWNSVNLNVKFGIILVELSAESAFLMSYNAYLLELL